MAGGKERVLRRRIKSVESSKKITRAMELIAASRIHKAQQRVAAARPYSEQITAVIRNLAAAGAGGSHPLLNARDEVRTVGFVVICADRGLAGGSNSGVLRQAERALKEEVAAGRDYRLILVGKKARDYFRFRGYTIAESFTGISDSPTYEDARAVGEAVRSRFEEGELDRVDIVYTQFLSVGTQRVVTRQFMPIEAETVTEAPTGPQADYEYEPEPDGILDQAGLTKVTTETIFSDTTANLIAELELDDVLGSGGFLTSPKVHKAVMKVKETSTDRVIPEAEIFHQKPAKYTTQSPDNIGISSDKSSLLFGSWRPGASAPRCCAA